MIPLGSFNSVASIAIAADQSITDSQTASITIAGHQYSVTAIEGNYLCQRMQPPSSYLKSFIEFFTHRLFDCSLTSRAVRIQQKLSETLTRLPKQPSQPDPAPKTAAKLAENPALSSRSKAASVEIKEDQHVIEGYFTNLSKEQKTGYESVITKLFKKLTQLQKLLLIIESPSSFNKSKDTFGALVKNCANISTIKQALDSLCKVVPPTKGKDHRSQQQKEQWNKKSNLLIQQLESYVKRLNQYRLTTNTISQTPAHATSTNTKHPFYDIISECLQQTADSSRGFIIFENVINSPILQVLQPPNPTEMAFTNKTLQRGFKTFMQSGEMIDLNSGNLKVPKSITNNQQAFLAFKDHALSLYTIYQYVTALDESVIIDTGTAYGICAAIRNIELLKDQSLST